MKEKPKPKNSVKRFRNSLKKKIQNSGKLTTWTSKIFVITMMTNEQVEQTLLMRMNPNPDPEDPWNRSLFTPEERQEIINYYQRIVLWDEIPKEDAEELTRRMVEFA